MTYEVFRIPVDRWRDFRRVRLEALRDSPLAFNEPYQEAVARPDEQWRARLVSGIGPTMFGVAAAGELVGIAGGVVEPEPRHPRTVQVVSVYVTSAHRGSGAAELLVRAVVEWARIDAAAGRIRLFVLADNDRALALYRRCGFVPTGRSVPYPRDPTLTEDELEYHPARSGTEVTVWSEGGRDR